MTPAEQRATVLNLCQDYAAAVSTGRPGVINAVAINIEQVILPRLFPDKPTLEQVQASLLKP